MLLTLQELEDGVSTPRAHKIEALQSHFDNFQVCFSHRRRNKPNEAFAWRLSVRQQASIEHGCLLQVEVYHKALQKAQSRLGGLFKKKLARAQSGAPSSPMSNQATAVLLDDMLTYSQVC